MDLVLASTSRYRAALLSRLGTPFVTAAPQCDEQALQARGWPVEVLVTELARRKAQSVADRFPDALVIGSDQAAELDGRILGKPGTRAAARAQLRQLRGREHRLLTAICVLQTSAGRLAEDLDVHRLRLRDLTDAQIERYVAADNPVDCAGAYKVEGLGVSLFEHIRGDDFTAVIGLPLTRLVRLLAGFGLELP